MTLSYEDMHKLFCPDTSWYEARLKAITNELKEEWLLAFSEYCKCVERAAKREIMTYAKGLQGEIDTQRILHGKNRL